MSEAVSYFKQRITGALVLIALAMIVVPMLFPGKEEALLPQVEVQAPPPPLLPPVPDIRVEPVQVPEPVMEEYEPVFDTEPEFVLIENEHEIITPVESTQVEALPDPVGQSAVEAAKPAVTPKPVVEAPVRPAPQPKPEPKPEPEPVKQPVARPASPGVDRNNLPVSWSIQLASLASLANAERLRDTYRARHYTAYVRSSDGMHRVLIGPLIREAEAVAMCKQLKNRDKQDCFVVRYQP